VSSFLRQKQPKSFVSNKTVQFVPSTLTSFGSALIHRLRSAFEPPGDDRRQQMGWTSFRASGVKFATETAFFRSKSHLLRSKVSSFLRQNQPKSFVSNKTVQFVPSTLTSFGSALIHRLRSAFESRADSRLQEMCGDRFAPASVKLAAEVVFFPLQIAFFARKIEFVLSPVLALLLILKDLLSSFPLF